MTDDFQQQESNPNKLKGLLELSREENAELKYKLLVYEDIIKEIRKLLKDVE